MSTDEVSSPRWNATTKLTVALAALVLIGWVLWRFQVLIAPLVSAAMLAYLLNPIITFLSARLRWPRALAAALIYLALVLLLLGSLTGASIYLVNQVAGLSVNVEQIIRDLPDRINQLIHSQINVFGFALDLAQFDFSAIYDQIASSIQPALSRAGTIVGQAASSTAEFLGWTVIVMFISFYIVKDMPNFRNLIGRAAADPGYQDDVTQLIREFQHVWDAFLRGQLTLAIVIWLIVWVGLTILGVRYAFVLALLSGMLEFVPTIGPLIAGAVAVGVALFQDSNWFGFSPLIYALIVTAFFIIVQQIENNLLVPRIIGEHLDLHPVLIMIGAIMGASLGGILGLLLAAPVLATLKLFGRYAWRKMLDLPPFEDTEPPKQKPMFALPRIDFKAWFRRKDAKKTTDVTESNK